MADSPSHKLGQIIGLVEHPQAGFGDDVQLVEVALVDGLVTD